MKPIAFFLFIIAGWNCSAQKQFLKIVSEVAKEQQHIDSIGYNKIHPDAKSIVTEVQLISEKLTQAGYIESQIESSQKINDSTFLYQFQLRKKVAFIHIYISNNSPLKKLDLFDSKKDTVTP